MIQFNASVVLGIFVVPENPIINFGLKAMMRIFGLLSEWPDLTLVTLIRRFQPHDFP